MSFDAFGRILFRYRFQNAETENLRLRRLAYSLLMTSLLHLPNLPLSKLAPVAPDPLLSLTSLFAKDTRDRKIDLGVGVYRNSHGVTPVFAAIKEAEQRLAACQPTKAYLGPDGNAAFVEVLSDVALGLDRPVRGLQTLGGTGALFLACVLLASEGTGPTIWLQTPTWSNHLPIFLSAGLAFRTVDSGASEGAGTAQFLAALEQANAGDAVLLQACCHNPTGVDFSSEDWAAVAALCGRKGLTPLVDIAYQGFGDGWDEDMIGLRTLAAAVPELLIAYSCDKNFGLYRERVGALFVAAETTAAMEAAHGHLMAHARGTYSMPADHGAAAVLAVLQDHRLTADWRAELENMRQRVTSVRSALARAGCIGACDFGRLEREHGMFSLLPLGPDTILQLRSRFGIYMAPSGRINLAGLRENDIAYFVDALQDVQEAFA
jgi:aromatic-amino-acid transaminase